MTVFTKKPDDFVSRESVINLAYTPLPPFSEYGEVIAPCDVSRLPAADVAPVDTAEWIVPHPKILPRCSKCGDVVGAQSHRTGKDRTKPPYCPNCGRRMAKGAANEK